MTKVIKFYIYIAKFYLEYHSLILHPKKVTNILLDPKIVTQPEDMIYKNLLYDDIKKRIKDWWKVILKGVVAYSHSDRYNGESNMSYFHIPEEINPTSFHRAFSKDFSQKIGQSNHMQKNWMERSDWGSELMKRTYIPPKLLIAETKKFTYKSP